MSYNYLKISFWVTAIMVLGYVLSFMKEAVIANYYGISASVDAYTIAIQVPVTLFAFISVAIQSIVVPLYSDLLYKTGYQEADKFINNLLTIVLLLTVSVIVIGELSAGIFISVFAPGFDPPTHDLAKSLLQVTWPSIVFTVVSQIFVAILNVHKQYIWPAFAVYFLNISIILCTIFLHQQWGIFSACVGQVIGAFLNALFLFALIRKYYHYKFDLRFKDLVLNKALKMTLPVLWSISVAEINAMINRSVASFLFIGSIASLGYASKINSLLMTFFVSAISSIVYPLYAEASAKGDIEQLNVRINKTLSAYALLLIPAFCFLFCYKTEIVSVAFARGAFEAEAVKQTAALLGYYSIGLLFMSFRETLTKIFYSLKDTKTPAKNATLGVFINIILNLSLPFAMGVNGLALATSISAIFIASRLLFLLIKRNNKITLSGFITNIKPIVLSSFFLFIIIYILRTVMIGYSSYIILLTGSVTSICLYLLLNSLFKVPIFIQLKANFRKSFI